MRDSGANQNQAVNCCMNCLHCIASCFERFIQFLNHHAYVEIILTSNNFCTSAGQAMSLLTSNVLRFGTLSTLVALIMFFGKVLITGIVVLISYLMLMFQTKIHNTVFETYAPLIVIGIVGWIVSSLFVHVYECASDSMLHCYCYEELINRQAGTKPRLANRSLQL
jgi:Plasma-membrane choline transporter